MLSERSQTQKTIYFMIRLYEISTADKSIEIKSRLVVRVQEWGKLRETDKGYRVAFGDDGCIHSGNGFTAL